MVVGTKLGTLSSPVLERDNRAGSIGHEKLRAGFAHKGNLAKRHRSVD